MQKTTLPTQGNLLPHLCAPQSIVGLLLAGELLALALVLSRSNLRAFCWPDMGAVSMVIQWVMLSSAAALCHLRPVFRRFPPAISGALAYTVVLTIAVLVLAAGQWILNAQLRLWELLTNMLIVAIFAGILLRYLYLQQQLHNQRQAELQSRIHALQARIRPHFLFNSMNTIASLIAIDSEAAERAIENLSEVFRASLQCADLIPLADELSLCRSYVAIEQVRLGERLTVKWQCGPFPTDIDIPSLSLQPLIENAIYHGIQRLRYGGIVEVHINSGNNGLFIQVRNPFPSRSKDSDKLNNHQMAMSNINYRLQAHYGHKASLTVQIQPGDKGQDYYFVSMRLPLSEKTLVKNEKT